MEQPLVIDRKRENIVILAVFLVALVLITAMTILPGKKPAVVRPPVCSLQIDEGAQTEDNATAVARERLDPDTIVRAWGTDPFARKAQETELPPLQETADQAAGEDLVVTLILIGGNQKTARINNQNYHEGDVVNGAKIISIEKNGVVVERNGSRVMLARKGRAPSAKRRATESR